MADDAKGRVGFVSLTSLAGRRLDAAAALAEIRRLYFTTSRPTIERDFAHAIALLKGLPSEDERGKAAVYMEGLAQMRKEWHRESQRSKIKGQRSGQR
jgi:hypothetical protein